MEQQQRLAGEREHSGVNRARTTHAERAYSQLTIDTTRLDAVVRAHINGGRLQSKNASRRCVSCAIHSISRRSTPAGTGTQCKHAGEVVVAIAQKLHSSGRVKSCEKKVAEENGCDKRSCSMPYAPVFVLREVQLLDPFVERLLPVLEWRRRQLAERPERREWVAGANKCAQREHGGDIALAEPAVARASSVTTLRFQVHHVLPPAFLQAA